MALSAFAKQTPAARSANHCAIGYGAVERDNLEPSSISPILDELEEWGRFLSSKPELVQALKAFDEASRDTRPDDSPVKQRAPRRSGPSL